MAVAEDRSWEYTLGRIGERTEQHGKDVAELRSDVAGLRGDVNDLGDTVGRLNERTERHGKEISGLRTDANALKEAMLTKTTFFAVAAVITALLATMIAMK